MRRSDHSPKLMSSHSLHIQTFMGQVLKPINDVTVNNKCSITGSHGEKFLKSSDVQHLPFLWYPYSHHGQFQATEVTFTACKVHENLTVSLLLYGQPQLNTDTPPTHVHNIISIRIIFSCKWWIVLKDNDWTEKFISSPLGTTIPEANHPGWPWKPHTIIQNLVSSAS